MWTGFKTLTIRRDGVTLFARHGGPSDAGVLPLLLLHGHPQTMAMWHCVAPVLARTRQVVLMDLRGYGDSDRPQAGEASAAYTKREMALDAVALMRALGHERFAVLAHDRGARVAHRLALDHPAAVARLMLLDIAPTLAMYEGTTDAFARAYWHWFFLIQPAPLPERLIEADPLAYLRDGMGRRRGGLFAPAAWREYERCISKPDTAAAICGDYRAGAGIDLDHDPRRPRRWPPRGATHCVCCGAPWAWWAPVSSHSSSGRLRPTTWTGRAVDSGHYIAEEAPDLVLAEATAFFNGDE